MTPHQLEQPVGSGLDGRLPSAGYQPSPGVGLSYREVLDCLNQGVCLYGPDNRVITCNRQFADLYGLKASDVRPGTPLHEIAARRVGSGRVSSTVSENSSSGCSDPRSLPTQEVAHLNDGRSVLIQRRFLPNGSWLTMHEDITERKRHEERIVHLANHDVLTDVANRRVLMQRLQHAIARLADSEALALHMIDLDDFKSVNDRFGHAAGDQVLREVARRLQDTVRPTDLVARLGGDEFAVLQLEAGDDRGAEALAKRLITALARPFVISGRRFTVGGSIGIATCDRSSFAAESLMANADHALYQAKGSGRDRYCHFTSQLDHQVRLRNQIKDDLAKAIVREELELYYQPLIDLGARRVSGFEALIRWNHPARGRISPMDFIPIAEETGLIVPIGDWVMKTACAAAMGWPRSLRVSVNISPVQFQHGEPAHSIGKALSATGLEPSRLECEITESSLMRNVDATVVQINAIKSRGVSLALDDFGTGYASLSCLSRFPFDKLKVDRAFVNNLEQAEHARAMLRTIVGLGRDLGMKTTVEGVETAKQLTVAMHVGCNEAQGYLFKPPIPLKDIDNCLADMEKSIPGAILPLLEKNDATCV